MAERASERSQSQSVDLWRWAAVSGEIFSADVPCAHGYGTSPQFKFTVSRIHRNFFWVIHCDTACAGYTLFEMKYSGNSWHLPTTRNFFLSLSHFDLLILLIISISLASRSVSPGVPPCVCSGCGRFSYSSDYFSESNRCIKCGLFMVLEVRLSSWDTVPQKTWSD